MGRIDPREVDKLIDAALAGGRVPRATILALALLWDCAEPGRMNAETLRPLPDPEVLNNAA